MARSKAEVDLIVSQRQAAQAFNDLASKAKQALQQMQDKMDQINKKNEEEKQNLSGWQTAINKATTAMQSFWAVTQSGKGLVNFIRREFEAIAALQDESKDIEFRTELALQQLRNKLPTQSDLDLGRIPKEQFVSEARVENLVRNSFDRLAMADLIGTAISAGLGTPKQAVDVAEAIARVRPETLASGEAKDLAGAVMDLSKVLDARGESWKPEGLIALISAAEKEARQTSTGQFASTGAQLMSVLIQEMNATPAQAAAFVSAATQAGIDVEGAMTRTGGANMFAQIKEELRGRGIFKDGRELNFGEAMDFFAGRGEFKDFRRDDAVAIAKRLGGLQIPGMSIEEIEEAREVMMSKKRVTDAELKGKLRGSKSHMRGIMLQFVTPPELAPGRDELLLNKLMDDSLRVLPKDEAEAIAFQHERPVRPMLQAQIAAREFMSGTLTPEMAARAEMAKLVERANVVRGQTAAIGKLRGIMERLGEEPTAEVFGEGAESLRSLVTPNSLGIAPSKEQQQFILQIRVVADRLEAVAQQLKERDGSRVQQVEIVNDRTKRQAAQQPPAKPNDDWFRHALGW